VSVTVFFDAVEGYAIAAVAGAVETDFGVNTDADEEVEVEEEEAEGEDALDGFRASACTKSFADDRLRGDAGEEGVAETLPKSELLFLGEEDSEGAALSFAMVAAFDDALGEDGSGEISAATDDDEPLLPLDIEEGDTEEDAAGDSDDEDGSFFSPSFSLVVVAPLEEGFVFAFDAAEDIEDVEDVANTPDDDDDDDNEDDDDSKVPSSSGGLPSLLAFSTL
jgi:hypothetical protein